MNSYELSRNWFNYCFENPEQIKPNHSALYFFAIEHCNRLGWKNKFGFPSQMVMEALGIKNWRTYSKTLNELESFGFIKILERSKNQYSSNIIAIVENTKARTKALDKALQKHSTKQGQSIVSIIKQYNKEQLTLLKGEVEMLLKKFDSNDTYTETDFIKDWNETRTEVLKKPSYIKTIPFFLKDDLTNILNNYEQKDIITALKGLFKQKNLPNNNTSMQSDPKHFIQNFERYLQAGTDMNPHIYGNQDV